eukprot:6948686-Pyramimonas_sp.AAC.1
METTTRASGARRFTSYRRPPKLDGCREVCKILLTEKEKWGEVGSECAIVCVGQANHEGICACVYHIGVPAAATDSRTPRSRA